MRCINCGKGLVSDRDEYGYPTCREQPFVEKTENPEYESFFKNNSNEESLLPVSDERIDKEFSVHFNNKNRLVPNPCAFDAFTGKPFNTNQCYIDFSVSKSGRTYFCNTNVAGIATMKYNDDYLSNNGGKYANACYSFLNNKAVMDLSLIHI